MKQKQAPVKSEAQNVRDENVSDILFQRIYDFCPMKNPLFDGYMFEEVLIRLHQADVRERPLRKIIFNA